MKEFFGIVENRYQFEMMDITALLTVLNVALLIAGFWFAPIFGLLNCVLSIVLFCKGEIHINAWIVQITLIILNLFFLLA